MNAQETDELILSIMNDPKKIRNAMQLGINEALLRHKQMGNPICEWRDGKVVWIQPEDIVVSTVTETED